WNADAERGRATKQWLTTEDVGLPQDFGPTFVIGVATPERDAPLRSEIVGEVAEYRPRFRLHGTGGRGCETRKHARERGVQPDVKCVICICAQIIEAANALERALV